MKYIAIFLSLLATSLSAQVNKNTGRKKIIIIEQQGNKTDSLTFIKLRQFIDSIKTDSSNTTMLLREIEASIDKADLNQDFLLSLWPGQSIFIIDGDTVVNPYKKFRTKTKAPLIVHDGGLKLGFATPNRPYYSSATVIGPYSEMPELKTSSSIHFGLASEWGIRIGSGHFRLWSGINYDILNYQFADNNIRLKNNQPNFTTFIDTGVVSEKSKVVVNYIAVPLSIGYHSKKRHPDEGFSIKAGVSAGYRVRTHTKVKYDNNKTEKTFDDFNFNDFLITPFVQMAYNNVGLYLRVNTSPVFKANEGFNYEGMQFGLVFQ
jgi:hypothetical protein